MSTLFNIIYFRKTVTTCCSAIACLVILSAPIITIPVRAFAEEAPQGSQVTEPSSPPEETTTPNSEQPQDTPIDTTIVSPVDTSTPAPSGVSEPESSATQQGVVPNTNEDQALTSQSSVESTNNLNSEAITGNTSVTGASSAGALATGDAVASTTTITVVQSSIGLSGSQQPLVFNLDIVGDTTGDILIDPSALDATPIGTAYSDGTANLSNSTETGITNNLSLTAVSGDVLATDNRIVGNIQSGDASAVANVLNLLNSAISADRSFIGTINILGNLNGDILIPAEFINDLIASGQAIPLQLESGSILNSSNTVSIANNVLSAAISGNVLAQDNSLTGDISTGNSQTSINIISLIGQQTISRNTLLIFINVLGTWTGLLFNAPAGSTTASITGGSLENNANLSGINSLNQSSTMTIVNNISLLAQTGDASAIGNKRTGAITTGNASTGANILNIVNSQLNFSDWFGILFINVFGVWNGSLAAAPDPVSEPASTGGPETAPAGPPQVFSFVAANTIKPSRLTRPAALTYTNAVASNQDVASAATVVAPRDLALVAQIKIPPTNNRETIWLILGGVLLATGVVSTRYYSSRNSAS